MARKFKIKNWEKFQHYKDRNPPWIKLHVALLSSEDWVTLDDASRLLAVVCMVVAAKDEGHIPDNAAYIQRIAYLRDVPDFGPLISCGFLQEVIAPDSNTLADASVMLADARPETEERQRQNRGEKEQKVRADARGVLGFSGTVVRLNVKDFDRWKSAYSNLDLAAELTARDAWLASDSATDDDRKRWFVSTSKYLANRNAEARAKGQQSNLSDVYPDEIYRGLQ